MRNKATLKEVAKAAGVSPITVSRFINTPDQVSSSAREKIVAAIEQTGYIPNAAARQLKTNQSDIVFFVVPNIRNELYASLSHELMLKLAQYNKSLFICDYNFQDQLEQMLIQEIYKHRPAAIVMASGDGMSEAQLQLLNASQIPVIQFDRINPQISSVMNIEIDNFAGGQLAAQRLIQQKVTRAVILAGKTKRVMSARIEGFTSVFQQAGLVVDIARVDFANQQISTEVEFDVSGETGYFLLNSDIANTFLLQHIEPMSGPMASRVVSFDPVTNGAFLPFQLATISYQREQFVESISQILHKIFEQKSTKADDVIIPVGLCIQAD